MLRRIRIVLVVFALLTIATPVSVLAQTSTLSSESSGTIVNLESGEQLSGAGGIGNTRDDVLAAWGISAGMKPDNEVIDGSLQIVLYNLPDYQLTFGFLVGESGKPTEDDRLIEVSYAYMGYPSRSTAMRKIRGFMPDDAKEVSGPTKTPVGDGIWKYHSDATAEAFPQIDHYAFEEAGDIYLMTWPDEGKVGVVYIGLLNPLDTPE